MPRGGRSAAAVLAVGLSALVSSGLAAAGPRTPSIAAGRTGDTPDPAGPPMVGDAPPGYGAASDGALLRVDATTQAALSPTTGLRLGAASATANSRQAITATALAADLEASADHPPATPVLVSRVEQDAPPDNTAAIVSRLADAPREPYLRATSTSTSAFAPGTGPAGCAPGGLAARAVSTTTAAMALLPRKEGLVELPGMASSTAETGLVPVPGQDGYGVYAKHELRISTITLLGSSVQIQVRSTPTLVAIAAGTSRSRVGYSAPSLDVRRPDGSVVTLNAVNPTATFPAPGGGTVTLTAGALHENAVTPLRVKVTATLLGVTLTSPDGSTTDLTIGDQSVLATAPTRGVSCANGLPAPAAPAEPITIQPVFSGGTGGTGGPAVGKATTPGEPAPAAAAPALAWPPTLPSTGVDGIGPLTSGGAGLLITGFGLILLAGRRRRPRAVPVRRRHARRR
ncbi:MAG: hypothetical protein HYR62_10345 [Actinobacteria bacterium]|nr:hypothetical protein [Actinomycetota bacterium]MBI3686355.1 hypothetical protein [Actinomycetota bacterium]